MFTKYIHRELSNGQIATVVLTTDLWAKSYLEVAFVIGSSRSKNKAWWTGKDNINAIKSTGTCGLEGLMFALKVLKEWHSRGYNLSIQWSDEKRHKAYQYLKRYGFVEGRYASHPEEKVLYWNALLRMSWDHPPTARQRWQLSNSAIKVLLYGFTGSIPVLGTMKLSWNEIQRALEEETPLTYKECRSPYEKKYHLKRHFPKYGEMGTVLSQYKKFMLRKSDWYNPNLFYHFYGSSSWEPRGSLLKFKHSYMGYVSNVGGKEREYLKIFTHFMPYSLREGKEMIEALRDSMDYCIFAVTPYLANMLERLGFEYLGEVPQIFAGSLVMKKVYINRLDSRALRILESANLGDLLDSGVRIHPGNRKIHLLLLVIPIVGNAGSTPVLRTMSIIRL